jgi:hypothetical protein
VATSVSFREEEEGRQVAQVAGEGHRQGVGEDQEVEVEEHREVDLGEVEVRDLGEVDLELGWKGVVLALVEGRAQGTSNWWITDQDAAYMLHAKFSKVKEEGGVYHSR